MARPLRIEVAGGYHHVSSRGNERRAIYRDDRDRRSFLGLLAGLTRLVQRLRKQLLNIEI
jgi:hypothetical protein